MDAFNARLGIGQGRLEAGGDFSFVLGDAEPGRIFELLPGDFTEIVQVVDLTDIDFVRVDMELSVPRSLPADHGWEVSIAVEGEKRARTVGTSGQTRRISDLAVNVSHLAGEHAIAVRLELVRVP